MKTENKSGEILKELGIWLIRFFCLFLTFCWFFFYRVPINILDGNIFYRLGGITEQMVILIVLYRILIKTTESEENKYKNE